jgi:hypothetical protein
MFCGKAIYSTHTVKPQESTFLGGASMMILKKASVGRYSLSGICGEQRLDFVSHRVTTEISGLILFSMLFEVFTVACRCVYADYKHTDQSIVYVHMIRNRWVSPIYCFVILLL